MPCFKLGPALGSFLFSIGGFTLPFVVVGSIGLVVATILVFVIPNVKSDTEKRSSDKALSFQQIAKSPSIFMPYIDLLVCFFGNGMITSMLEPHLNEAGADTNQVGLTFLIFGGVYMACTPVVGYVQNISIITGT
jgi:predicted MFS family arabinose efflux permease